MFSNWFVFAFSTFYRRRLASGIHQMKGRRRSRRTTNDCHWHPLAAIDCMLIFHVCTCSSTAVQDLSAGVLLQLEVGCRSDCPVLVMQRWPCLVPWVVPCEAAQKRISQSLQQLQRADPDLYELALMGEEASNAILSTLCWTAEGWKVLKYLHKAIKAQIQAHTHVQTYRHTDIQTYRHTDIQTYRHTHTHTHIYKSHIHAHTHAHTHTHT